MTRPRFVPLSTWGHGIEAGLIIATLLALGLLPILEWLLRTCCQRGIPGATGYVQHLTLWIGCLGAMAAARQGRHLTFSTEMLFLPPGWQGKRAAALAALAATTVTSGLCWASLRFVRSEMAAPVRLAGWLPLWVVDLILPVAFAGITLQGVRRAGSGRARVLACLGLPGAVALGFCLAPYAPLLRWPGLVGLGLAAVLGTPIFVILGGTALWLLFTEGVPVAALTVETYRMLTSATLPTIPLFTLAGYLLAEGGASQRLVRLFHALFGWLPGGLAVAATLVCAFFTTFTGASGVTILALGGVLLPILLRNGYPERFAIGLLTATGSIGLLFPPSLPVILYGVVAHVPIPALFRAGLVPGVLMIAAVCTFGAHAGLRSQAARPRFETCEAVAAFWEAKWDLLLPLLVLVGLFGGFCTLIEAAALTVVYAVLIGVAIHRDLHVWRDLPRALVTCATLMGGVLIILGVAVGLTNYLVDTEVPMQAATWVQAHVHSRALFLLALNLFLLIVVCLMDIFSATVVVVPLMVPTSQVFGIDPLHLGIVFLATMELGYLTPPVGLNLFLASYRFDKPVPQVLRHTAPFLLLLFVVILLITYIPALTLGVGAHHVPP